MKCVEREDLFAYVHKMLEPRQESEVRAHVEMCPACRGALGQFQRVDAILDEWKPSEPSPWFDARVRAAVAAGEPARSPGIFFGLRWVRWLAPALLVVVVAASLAILRVRRSHDLPPPVARQGSPQPTQPAPGTVAQPRSATPAEDEELSLYENLPVLEDYDLLANFEVLSELPKGAKKVAN